MEQQDVGEPVPSPEGMAVRVCAACPVPRETAGGAVVPLAKRTFQGVHAAIKKGLIRACHDLSEGGLAAAVAEMTMASLRRVALDEEAARQEALTAEVKDLEDSFTKATEFVGRAGGGGLLAPAKQEPAPAGVAKAP